MIDDINIVLFHPEYEDFDDSFFQFFLDNRFQNRLKLINKPISKLHHIHNFEWAEMFTELIDDLPFPIHEGMMVIPFEVYFNGIEEVAKTIGGIGGTDGTYYPYFDYRKELTEDKDSIKKFIDYYVNYKMANLEEEKRQLEQYVS